MIFAPMHLLEIFAMEVKIYLLSQLILFNKELVAAGSNADRSSNRQPGIIERKECHAFPTNEGRQLSIGFLQGIR